MKTLAIIVLSMGSGAVGFLCHQLFLALRRRNITFWVAFPISVISALVLMAFVAFTATVIERGWP